MNFLASKGLWMLLKIVFYLNGLDKEWKGRIHLSLVIVVAERWQFKKPHNLIGTTLYYVLPELSLHHCLRETVFYKNIFRDIMLHVPSCSRWVIVVEVFLWGKLTDYSTTCIQQHHVHVLRHHKLHLWYANLLYVVILDVFNCHKRNHIAKAMKYWFYRYNEYHCLNVTA